MQPAMLKTFPVHNELPSSPAHNSPPGLNTIRLTNLDHYSIYDNSFPLGQFCLFIHDLKCYFLSKWDATASESSNIYIFDD